MNLADLRNFGIIGPDITTDVSCSDEVTFFATYPVVCLSVTHIDGRANENEIKKVVITCPMSEVRWRSVTVFRLNALNLARDFQIGLNLTATRTATGSLGHGNRRRSTMHATPPPHAPCTLRTPISASSSEPFASSSPPSPAGTFASSR